MPDVGLVAMDEFHYFGDPERGWAWQVPLLTLPQTQFLLMSATLGNVDAIANQAFRAERHAGCGRHRQCPTPCSAEL